MSCKCGWRVVSVILPTLGLRDVKSFHEVTRWGGFTPGSPGSYFSSSFTHARDGYSCEPGAPGAGDTTCPSHTEAPAPGTGVLAGRTGAEHSRVCTRTHTHTHAHARQTVLGRHRAVVRFSEALKHFSSNRNLFPDPPKS